MKKEIICKCLNVSGDNRLCPRHHLKKLAKLIPKVDMKQKNVPTSIVKAKTVFQEFADFLAVDAGDRDALFEVLMSNDVLVIRRLKSQE